MAIFSPYSQPQEDAKYIPEVPYDIYQRGVEHVAATNQENYQNVQSNLSGIFKNINPVSTADANVLAQKEKDVEAQVNKFSLSNLNNPQALSQLHGYLNQVSNDPDILAIHSRAMALQQELKTKKDYEEKGKKYISPLLDEASDYINNGVYLRDKRFNKQGYVDPELEKSFRENADKLKDDGTLIYDNKSHSWEKKEGVNLDRLNSLYQGLASTEGQQLYNDKTKKLYGDDLLGNFKQAKIDDLGVYEHNRNISSDPEVQQYWQQRINDANRYLDDATETTAFNYLKNKVINQDADRLAFAYHHEKTEIPKLDEAYKFNKEENDKFAEKLYQAKLDAGLVIDPITGNPIPGKADIAGETALLKKKATSGVQSDVYIHPDIEEFHNNLNEKNKDNIVLEDDGKPREKELNSTLIKNVFGYKEDEKGWHQVKSDAFLQNYMNFKKISPSSNSQLLPIIDQDGYPAVYVKGGKMIMEVKDNGVYGGTKYIPVNSQDVYSATLQQAKLTKGQREALNSSREANISGKYEETSKPIYSKSKSGKDIFSTDGGKTWQYK